MTRSIMPWGVPFGGLDRIFDETFLTEGFAPAMDVRQDKDHVIVEVALAGVDPEQVDITVENDVLTVSGSTESRSEVKREDYYRKEIRSGAFARSVILPMRVKGEAAEAHYDKGILRIVIPKADEVKPKKITIKTK